MSQETLTADEPDADVSFSVDPDLTRLIDAVLAGRQPGASRSDQLLRVLALAMLRDGRLAEAVRGLVLFAELVKQDRRLAERIIDADLTTH